MIDFSMMRLHKMAVHKVGNPTKDEALVLSNGLYPITDQLEQALIPYFTRSFKNDEYQCFHNHESNMQQIVDRSFIKELDFLDISKAIARLLYDHSNHSKIRTGELYVAQFKDCVVYDEVCDAIGIFKSEEKDLFLQVNQEDNTFQLTPSEGIYLKKLDKGCIILNTHQNDGYRIVAIDKTSKDATFWFRDFLGVVPAKCDNTHTKQVIRLARDFIDESIKNKPQEEAKTQEIVALNKTTAYLDHNHKFELNEFIDEVFGDMDLTENFDDYRKRYEEEREVPIKEQFEISKPAVQQMKRFLRKRIKLDGHIEIRLDLQDAEDEKTLIKRGFDEELGKHFYQLYFEHEALAL